MGAIPTDWGFAETLLFFGPKLFISLLCGGLVGLEREIKNKAAGLKTNMLICAGSAMYSAVSVLISNSLSDTGYFGDPGRVAAQIVAGAGFLGGGAIIQARGTIVGLTTAATVWVVAAIGIFVGLGHLALGLGFAVVTTFVVVGATVLEERFLSRSRAFVCEILGRDREGSLRNEVRAALKRNHLELEDFDVLARGELSFLRIRYEGSREGNRRFVLELWDLRDIAEVRQL